MRQKDQIRSWPERHNTDIAEIMESLAALFYYRGYICENVRGKGVQFDGFKKKICVLIVNIQLMHYFCSYIK